MDTLKTGTAMHTLNYYIDAALRVQNIESDRQLAFRLEQSAGNVYMWRSKKTMPSDDTIVKLAQLGKKDVCKALIDLNIWRSEGNSKNTYIAMAEYLNSQEQTILAAE